MGIVTYYTINQGVVTQQDVPPFLPLENKPQGILLLPAALTSRLSTCGGSPHTTRVRGTLEEYLVLYYAVVKHGVRYLYKSCDIGAVDIVDILTAAIFAVFNTRLVYIDHYLEQSLVYLVTCPR